jgi:hypothetical protein
MSQRKHSIALAFTIAVLVLLFYAVKTMSSSDVLTYGLYLFLAGLVVCIGIMIYTLVRMLLGD